MLHHFSIIALLLLSSLSSAQTATTIKIKKTIWKISISPEKDSILWIDKNNKLVVNVEGGSNYQVEIRDGKIKNKGNQYSIEVFTEGAATLTVYEKLPNKKMKPLYTKLYEVKRIPEPLTYVCGVKADSVIDKLQMIHDNVITAFDPFAKKALPVVSFEMIFSFSGQSDTLTSYDNHFTKDMKRRIYYLTSGSILYFENVYCTMPGGKIKKLKPFEIFVNDTDKYKIGYSGKGM